MTRNEELKKYWQDYVNDARAGYCKTIYMSVNSHKRFVGVAYCNGVVQWIRAVNPLTKSLL